MTAAEILELSRLAREEAREWERLREVGTAEFLRRWAKQLAAEAAHAPMRSYPVAVCDRRQREA